MLKEDIVWAEYLANVDRYLLQGIFLVGAGVYRSPRVTYQFLRGEYGVHDRDVRRRLVRRNGEHEDARIDGCGGPLPAWCAGRGVCSRSVDVCPPVRAFRAGSAEGRIKENSQHRAFVKHPTNPIGAVGGDDSMSNSRRERRDADPLPPRPRRNLNVPLLKP